MKKHFSSISLLFNINYAMQNWEKFCVRCLFAPTKICCCFNVEEHDASPKAPQVAPPQMTMKEMKKKKVVEIHEKLSQLSFHDVRFVTEENSDIIKTQLKILLSNSKTTEFKEKFETTRHEFADIVNIYVYSAYLVYLKQKNKDLSEYSSAIRNLHSILEEIGFICKSTMNTDKGITYKEYVLPSRK